MRPAEAAFRQPRVTRDGCGMWFGPPDRPLAGRLHAGSGHVWGGVVICPTLGVDALSSQPALFALSQALSDAGLLVLRFDYDGTGDSAGSDGPDRVAAWTGSVREATGELRRRGAGRVFVLGLSLGGLLAAAALASPGAPTVEGLVLWDPALHGNRWLRGQSVLARIAGVGAAASATGAVDVAGHSFSPETVAGLSELSLADALRGLTTRMLVLAPPGTRDATARTVPSAARADWREAADQGLVLGISPVDAGIPVTTIEGIVSELQAWGDGERRPVELSVDGVAVVGQPDAGGPVIERHVLVGPHDLPGVLTYNRMGGHAVDGSGPTPGSSSEGSSARASALFLPTAAEHSLGPGRSWVELSRSRALAGQSSLRLDLRFTGERPMEDATRSSYPSTAMDDIAAGLDALTGGNRAAAAVVGLCSGAFHAIEAGLSLGAGTVCAVNPVTNLTSVLHDAQESYVRLGADVGPPAWAERLAHLRVFRLAEAAVPAWLWRVVHGLRLVRSPAYPLRELVRAGRRVLLVCGPEQMEPYSTRASSDLRTLARTGAFSSALLATADHAVLERAGQEALMTVLGRFLHEQASPSPERLGAAPSP